jgi:Na+/H+ antiporter NhaA
VESAGQTLHLPVVGRQAGSLRSRTAGSSKMRVLLGRDVIAYFYEVRRQYTVVMAALQVPVRVSAVSLALSGVIVAVLLPLHPSILDRPVSDVVRETDVWQPLHVAFTLMFAFAFVGATGLVAVHGDKLRRLGQVGLGLSFAGVIGGVGIGSMEALAFPVLAEMFPEVLDLQGPLFTSWVFVGLGLLASGWMLGLALIGVAAARAAVFPRAAGVALAIGAVAFLALGAPFIPVAGIISGLAFGAAQIWWGWLLWKSGLDPRVS